MISTTARAAGEEPEALIRQGVELRREGSPSRALGYFQRAYDISHTPRSAAQLGLCELAVKSYVDAETHLREALATRDLWIQENRPTLEKSLSDTRQHLGQVDVTGAPAGASVAIGGRVVGTLPLVRTWVGPGEASLTVKADKFEDETRSLKVAAGDRLAEEVNLRPLVTPTLALSAPPTPSGAAPAAATIAKAPEEGVQTASRPIYGRWWFWAIVGAAVVGGVTAAVLATRSSGCNAGANVTCW